MTKTRIEESFAACFFDFKENENFSRKDDVICLLGTSIDFNNVLIYLIRRGYHSLNNYNIFWHNTHTLGHHIYSEGRLVKNTFECVSTFLTKIWHCVTFTFSLILQLNEFSKCFLLPSVETHFVKSVNTFRVSSYIGLFILILRYFRCSNFVHDKEECRTYYSENVGNAVH